MAKLEIKAGTTSKTLKIFVQNSSVTDGSGLTGLTNASGSLTGYYVREGANAAVSISIVSATLGTFTSGGFIVVDGTNMPGLYEIGIPDAAIAAGANSVVVMYKGAANMAPVVLEIELVAYDPYVATNLGLSAIPTANHSSSGGLLTFGTGTGQVNPSGGAVTTTYTIKKNTAFNNFEFQLVLASDHVSPAPGLTVTCERSIDGGVYAACTNGATSISAGTYKINLSAADLNGNMITFKFSAATADTTYVSVVTQS